jgi:hypothetical protein
METDGKSQILSAAQDLPRVEPATIEDLAALTELVMNLLAASGDFTPDPWQVCDNRDIPTGLILSFENGTLTELEKLYEIDYCCCQNTIRSFNRHPARPSRRHRRPKIQRSHKNACFIDAMLNDGTCAACQ